MQKYIGIYIESNIIKYAKLSKDRNDIKVESFGVRFFEDVGKEIDKIIEETYSFDTPVAVNLSNEKYIYFDVFALLNKKDVQKTIETEFASYCSEKQYNTNAFESRYVLAKKIDDMDKVRAIDVFANKIDMARHNELLQDYKLETILPIPMVIGSVTNLDKRQNQLIVNMEEKTTITSVIEQQVYNVETLDYGSMEVLDNINKIENSYAKAYDICKNTTIYTADVEETEQPYLLYIVPTIYKIAQRLQEITKDEVVKYQTVYLTGTLATINNIDLYFQEFLPTVEVKILKPKFLDSGNMKINIKDYIEVNSAIALALSGLGEGIRGINFIKETTTEKLNKLLKMEIGKPKNTKRARRNLRESFKSELSKSEMWTLRGCGTVLIFIIVFSIFSSMLIKSMNEKEKEIQKATEEQNSEIAVITVNKKKIDENTKKYESLIVDLEAIDRKTNDIAASKNLIPNLLSQLMFVIPDQVILNSIKNTENKTVSIEAIANDYDQLGYFIATLKTKKILNNVISSSGSKSGGTISVTIEGELP